MIIVGGQKMYQIIYRSGAVNMIWTQSDQWTRQGCQLDRKLRQTGAVLPIRDIGLAFK